MKKGISILLVAAALAVGTLPVYAQTPDESAAPLQPAQADRFTTTAQEFITLLAEEDYQAALEKYAPSSRASVTAATLEQGWRDAVEANGEYQRLVGVEAESLASEGGDAVAIATVEFANGTRDFFVVFTSDNQIVSIQPITQ
jgi:hypothetical protein